MVSGPSDGWPTRAARGQGRRRLADGLGMARLDYLLIVLAVVVLVALGLWTLELGALLAAPV